jgi:hypothetical protein
MALPDDTRWLARLSRTPHVPLSTWQVTTPAWTILVTHRGGLIVGISSRLRVWRGQDWTAFRQWVKATWPDQWAARRVLLP